MLRLGIVDEIVPEPRRRRPQQPGRGGGAARRAPSATRSQAVAGLTPDARVARRYEKFRNMGRLGIDFVDEGVNDRPVMPTLLWEPGRATRPPRPRWPSALGISPIIARLLCQRGLADPDAAARFLAPSLDQLHDPFRLAGMARGRGPHPGRHRPPRADRDPRRLRRGRHHVHGDPAARDRVARRRRRALPARTPPRRLRAAGAGRSSGCTPTASG